MSRSVELDMTTFSGSLGRRHDPSSLRPRGQEGTSDDSPELEGGEESLGQSMRSRIRTTDTKAGLYTPGCREKEMLLGGSER